MALALKLLDDAFAIDTNGVAAALDATWAEHHHTQKAAYLAALQLKADDADALHESELKRRLELYHELYEGTYRLLISPIALSKMIVSGERLPASLDGYVRADMKRKLLRFDTPLIYGSVALNRLLEGCLPPLRNGIAHKRYRFFENKVEVWDENAKGVYWRQSLSAAALDDIVTDLRNSIRGVETALLIFEMKHRDSLTNRGRRSLHAAPVLSLEEQQMALFQVAREMGMRFISAETAGQPPSELSIRLAIRKLNRPNRHFELSGSVGGASVGRFKFVERTVYVSLREDLFGVLQRAFPAIVGYDLYRVAVEGADGADLGYLCTSGSQLDRIAQGPDAGPVPELLEDTISPDYRVEKRRIEPTTPVSRVIET